MRLIILSVIFLIHQVSYSQTTIHFRDNNGKIITEKIYKKTTINNYTNKDKEQILLMNKYLDTTENIRISYGTNISIFSMEALSRGQSFSHLFNMPGTDDVLTIKAVKGKIIVNSVIYGFDKKYIAKIVNNRLITSKKYDMYTSDSSFELFDDYNIPVLQIELVKKENTMYVSGAFILPNCYVIISKQGMKTTAFSDYYALQKRDSLINLFIKDAKAIIPIHE